MHLNVKYMYRMTKHDIGFCLNRTFWTWQPVKWTVVLKLSCLSPKFECQKPCLTVDNINIDGANKGLNALQACLPTRVRFCKLIFFFSYGWEILISGWLFQGHSEKKLTTKTMSVEKLWLKQCRPRLILILLLIKGVYNDWK